MFMWQPSYSEVPNTRLERLVALDRHEQSLPARNDHVAAVRRADSQGIAQDADRLLAGLFVAKLQRPPAVHE